MKSDDYNLTDEKVEFYRHEAAPQANPLAGLSLILQGLIWETLDGYGFTWRDIISRRRPQDLADCRSLVFAFLAWHSDMTLVEIGKLVGNRDHGTVIHSRKKIAKMIDSQPKVAAFVYDLESRHLGVEDPSKVERKTNLKPEQGFALPSAARKARNAQKVRTSSAGYRQTMNSGLV